MLVREARGLTQVALSRALGISPQRWYNYERGNRVPPPDLLAKFWQITGGTSDYVLFGRMDGLPMELSQLLTTRHEKAAGEGQGRTPAAR